jgi:predicted Zn-dependent protease
MRSQHVATFNWAPAFLSAGYPDQALQYLDEIVRQTPANYKAQLAIGQIHLTLDGWTRRNEL